jgi:hypothetical protein
MKPSPSEEGAAVVWDVPMAPNLGSGGGGGIKSGAAIGSGSGSSLLAAADEPGRIGGRGGGMGMLPEPLPAADRAGGRGGADVGA